MARYSIVFACVCLVAVGARAAAAETVTIGGTGAALGTMELLADAYVKSHPGVSIEIPDSVGSGGAVKAVAKGRFDVGLTARPLKDEDTALGVREQPFAKTPFVLAVSTAVAQPASLTAAHVIALYDRRFTAWPDGTPARAILRPERETGTLLLIDEFPGIGPVLASARAAKGRVLAETDQEAMDLAQDLPGAVTPATLAAIVSERRPLAGIWIDGVAPSVENLDNGTYAMSLTLWFVFGPRTSERALDFVRFVYSDAGAAILRAHGSLPVHTNAQNAKSQ